MFDPDMDGTITVDEMQRTMEAARGLAARV